MIVLIKDLRGIRLQKCVEDSEVSYTLDNGMVVGRTVCWPATSYNVGLALVDLASKGRMKMKYKHMDESFDQLELEAAQVVVLLRKQGYDVDSELRIRRRMGKPFTEITDQHILPIIVSHLKTCEEKKKDPENVPVAIGMFEDHIIFRFKDKVASGTEEGGCISIIENKRVVLTFGDWHYVPKNATTGMLVHYLKCEPTGASSVKELCGKGQIMVEDGVMVQWGLQNLVNLEQKIDFTDVSIEDIIGGEHV